MKILFRCMIGWSLLCTGCVFFPDSVVNPPPPSQPPSLAVETAGTKAIPRERLGNIRNMIAVVIGVSKYAHDGDGSPKLKNLNYAAADADALAAHLVRSRFNVVEVLTDEKATRKNIQATLQDRVGKAGKDDFVLVFWAGHGSADPRDPQKLYLITHDTDPDDLAGTAYPMAEFRKDIASTQSSRLMVIVDTCHSGGVSDPTIGYRGSDAPDLQTALRGVYVADTKSEEPPAAMRLVFTACEAGEVSRESSEYGHGVFTHFLLKGLQGDADSNRDGIVTLDDVIEYTRSKVRSFSDKQQNPCAAGVYDRSIPLGISAK